MNSILFCLLTNLSYANPVMHYSDYHGHDNYWEHSPTIIICKSQTIFTKEQVKKAADLWKKDYKKIIERENCTYKEEKGTIKIVDGKLLDPGNWGYTSYYYFKYEENGKTIKELTSALVQINKNITSENILIHELGHAFGYNHYDAEYDVMNSEATYWDTWTDKYPY